MSKLSHNVLQSAKRLSFPRHPSSSLLSLPSFMPSCYPSRSLPRCTSPPLSFLPLPLPSPPPSPPLSDSKPVPLSPSTDSPSPPPNHITTFLSTLFNLPKRSPCASHQPIPPPFHSLSSLSSIFPFFDLPLSTAASTILLTSLSNSPDAAYSVFLSIKHPDAIAFGALIAVLCRAGRTEEALGVFDLMLERELRPTARTCTCILKAYCVEGRVREAQRFLSVMENKIGGGNETGDGILPTPDVITYTVYIEGLCLVRDFDSVAQVLKQAEEETSTWKPNSVTYNVYMSGLCRAGMLSEAFHQVSIMRKKGIQPTIETLNILFDCLCRNPRTVYKAKNLLERSRELHWEVDSFLYNTLMSRLLELGKPIRALKPLTDMVKKGIKPDICSFTILARSLCKAGKFRLAKFIITSIEIEVDITAYNTMLHELFKVGEFQEQKLLYLHMLERNVLPSKFTFGIIIDCLCKEGNFVEAVNYVIELFEDRLFDQDLVSRLNKWLVACHRLGDILHLLDEMSKRSLVLSPPLFDSLIKAFCWKGYCKGEEFYKISLILDSMLRIT